MTDEIQIKDGFAYGQWKKGINRTGPEVRALLESRGEQAMETRTNTVGSIHDSKVAEKVGMRGGVVAGIVHLDLFPKVMSNTFGQKWFKTGTLSMFYTYAILHGEELRAIIEVPPRNADDFLGEARLESKDDHLVAKGTVSIGNPKEKSYLQAQDIKSSPKEERRIYKDLEIGYEPPPRDVLIESSALIKGAEFREDSMDWHIGESPWGGAIVPPSRTFGMMQISPPFTAQGVGFYGATEIHYINGPVKADFQYETRGKIIAVGVTGKTEYYWFDSQLFEKESGALVAELRHMTRSMKAGSPLYPEL